MKMMKKTLPFLLLTSMAAFANDSSPVSDASQAPSTAKASESFPGIVMTDPTTLKKRKLTFQDTQNPDALATMLPRIDGVEDLFRTYVKKGYHPFHAMILTNADLSEVLRKVNPNVPFNETIQTRTSEIRNLYQPM